MKFTGRILLFVAFTALSLCVQAQLPSATSNLRQKKLAVSDSTRFDTLSIIPSSFIIAGIDTADYRLDFVNAVLHWNNKPEQDSITISYRVFPFRLNSVVQRLSYDSVVNNFYIKPHEVGDAAGAASKGLFNFGNLQYNGSFGRGIAFGNNQDAVVNSSFQLQLNGMLRDSIEIAAALTDNNIPIQPDGTTQQLNEFDQVFLQFKKKNWQLNLGDIDIRQNNMYFLNFYKRLQGITFQTKNNIGSKAESNTMVSGSIAKGKFSRNVFQGLEGNQGPYRLTGANSEFFFIVLANTERVFIDGELLQRGEDQDYVINYNTAEVTFMPRRMITKDSRIQIEFEYADRNFLNSNLFLSQDVLVNNKLKLRVAAFSNNDAKNSQINQTLDDPQRQFLFNLGDSIRQALYPTAVIDSFSTQKILYERVYDTIGTVVDSFYRYSTDPAKARFSLSFTDLGEGRGNYVPDFNGANGKVYRYVAPVNGVKQGRYEPVLILVTPKKQQLIAFGTDYQFNKNNFLKTELAVSNYDVNTFSPKDGGDDQGLAAKIQYSGLRLLNVRSELQWLNTIEYEHVQQRFKPIERLRAVEFTREWGLPLVVDPATENIMRFSSGLRNKFNHGATYQFTSYQRSDNYKGYQNLLQHTVNSKGWVINNQFSITSFNNQFDKGSFLRPVLDIGRRFKQLGSIQAGVRYALEQNEVRNKSNDSVTATSFSFDTYSAYLKTDESRQNKYALSFFTRSDKYPTARELVRGDRSYNVNFQAELLKNSRHQFLLNTTYRVLKVYNEFLSSQRNDKTILGRAEYMVNEWKGFLTGSVLYDLGTGQEQRRDFTYIEVPAGQGEFTWIDLNNDNIQQLNEFEIAVFRDQAKFIRLFVPTNEFVKANYTSLNYSLNLSPRLLLTKSGLTGIKNFVSRLSVQSSLQKTKKSVARGDFELSPFKYALQDTALITLNTSVLNTLSFNRYSSKWGIDISNRQNTGKALLTYGYESRQQQDWTAKLRWLFSRSFTMDVNSRLGNTALFTPSFGNRNYDIALLSTEPRISYIKGTVFRVQTSYRLEKKMNQEEFGGEESLSHSLHLDTKYNVLQNSTVNARVTYNNISYSRKATTDNPTVTYIMLEGLLPGRNYLWSVDLTKRLLNNVELNFQYEGRKPGETRTIHTGRAALRALF